MTQSPVGSGAERPHICQQKVPVEVERVLHSLHTLYDWGSTVTLVRRESARRMGLRHLRTVQRSVRGFKGSTVIIDGCHFLPLVDAGGNYQGTYEVEEITTVARTRLSPWAREVFPSVRTHMPWMDTEAGPLELLIGLDNTQWLPIHLEESRNQEDNMRLMKSAFGHQFMIMGGWGTSFYPRDASMRYRGDPTEERAGNVGGTQEAQLQARESRDRGTGDRGRVAVKRQSPPRGRTAPARGQRGTQLTGGHQRGRGRRPAQSDPPRDPPSVRGRPIHSRPWPSHSMLPDISQHEGSCASTPGVCPACSSLSDQLTPCRGWPS